MWRLVARDREGKVIAEAVLGESGQEITIGREETASLQLLSPGVSRRHARVLVEGASPIIVDEKSANGVFVEGKRISQPTRLCPGMAVEIGDCSVAVEGGSDVPQA